MKAEYEILCKFKKMLIEDKKHLRFGDWNQADIEVKEIQIQHEAIKLLLAGFEQASFYHLEAYALSCKSLRKRFSAQEE